MATRSSTVSATAAGSQVGRATLPCIALAVILLYPLNASQPNAATFAIFGLIGLTAAVTLLQGALRGSRATLPWLAALAVTVATLTQVPDRAIPVATLLATVAVGIGATRSPWLATVLLGCVSLHLAVLGYEWITSSSVLARIGVPLRVEYGLGAGGFRATGLMGHPLASSFAISIPLAAATLRLWPRSMIRGRLLLMNAVGGTAAAVFTGTRSVLLVTLVGVCILSIALMNDHTYGRGRMAALLLMFGALTAVLSTGGLEDQFATLRVFNLESVATESSYTVRANVLSNLQYAEGATSCDSVCQVVGHGYRASTDFFFGRELATNVRTFDNIFATLWFDFHLISLLIVGALLSPLLGRHSQRAPSVFAASLLLLAGLFFDVLYNYAALASLVLVLVVVGKADSMDGMLFSKAERAK